MLREAAGFEQASRDVVREVANPGAEPRRCSSLPLIASVSPWDCLHTCGPEQSVSEGNAAVSTGPPVLRSLPSARLTVNSGGRALLAKNERD